MADGLTGNLAQMPLTDMLRMLTGASQSGRLELADRTERGVLYLEEGAVVHAVSGPLAGEQAFRELLTWTAGQFRFEGNVPTPEVSITLPTAELMERSEHYRREREAVRKAIPATDRSARLARLIPGPVSLAPLEWRIVVQLTGEPVIAALPDILGVDEFTVLKALSGLMAAGLVEVERQPAPAPARTMAGADFFRALSQAAATALGPMAPVIIDEEIAALGATREAFPADRVSSLVERVAAEIHDEDQRLGFQRKLLPAIRQQAA